MHKASIVLAAGRRLPPHGPGRDDAPLLEAGRRRLRRRAPAAASSQTSRKVGAGPARRRPQGRARPPPDALRRPRGDARPALRHARGHRRVAPDGRGARGVRGAGADGHGHVRRRRLRGDPPRRPRRRPTSIVWDGGNNDFPFFAPDLLIVVADPLRPGHELRYHPGETNLRMADVVVINKVDSAEAHNVEQVVENVEAVNPMATLVFAKSPPTLDDGPDLLGKLRARRRRRADAHARRDAVRRRTGRGAQRGRGEDRRPAAVRRRLAQGRVRQVAAADERAAGDGLLRRAAARARGRRSTPPTATSSSPARRSTWRG